MKTKTFKLVVVFLFLTGSFFSCSEKSEIDPQKAILGKWEYSGHGEDKNHIKMFKTDCYWEFLPNGATKTYLSGWSETEVFDSSCLITGIYEIDAHFLVRRYYSEDGAFIQEDRYKYKLTKNQLQLTNEPMNFQGPYGHRYIELHCCNNIYIFKRIN